MTVVLIYTVLSVVYPTVGLSLLFLAGRVNSVRVDEHCDGDGETGVRKREGRERRGSKRKRRREGNGNKGEMRDDERSENVWRNNANLCYGKHRLRKSQRVAVGECPMPHGFLSNLSLLVVCPNGHNLHLFLSSSSSSWHPWFSPTLSSLSRSSNSAHFYLVLHSLCHPHPPLFLFILFSQGFVTHFIQARLLSRNNRDTTVPWLQETYFKYWIFYARLVRTRGYWVSLKLVVFFRFVSWLRTNHVTCRIGCRVDWPAFLCLFFYNVTLGTHVVAVVVIVVRLMRV